MLLPGSKRWRRHRYVSETSIKRDLRWSVWVLSGMSEHNFLFDVVKVGWVGQNRKDGGDVSIRAVMATLRKLFELPEFIRQNSFSYQKKNCPPELCRSATCLQLDAELLAQPRHRLQSTTPKRGMDSNFHPSIFNTCVFLNSGSRRQRHIVQ